MLSARRLLIFIFAILLAAVPALTSSQDYYSILGLSRSATKQEIKKAYKMQAMKYHPDKNPGNKKAEEMFLKLSQAYETLNDEEKRRIYDQFGEEGLKQQGGGGGFHDPFDIFSKFASGFGFDSHHQDHKKTGPSLQIDLTVELRDLYLGKTFEVDVSKQIICPSCRGTGAKDSSDVHICSSCQGRGIRVMEQMLAPGFVQRYQITCDVCGGKGKVVKSQCPICKGSKVQRGNSRLNITVERGMSDGEKIVFERKADQHPNYTPGNIIFVLRTSPHPVFTRLGDNIYTSLTIGLLDALLGFEREIEALDGRKIKVVREGVTQHGFTQTIPNEGMPIHNYPSTRGTLYVEYHVVLPEKLTEEEQDAIRKIFRKS